MTTNDDLLNSILLLPAGNAPWQRDGLRCVRAKVTSTSPDIASCVTSEGEHLLLPASEQAPSDNLRVGDAFTALRFTLNERPLLSRTRPELVALLAEGIVPELRSGAVRLMDIARAPGVRTKVAVAATVPGIDPVSTVVGKSANRVRALTRLLGDERLDVVAWHDERDVYLANAFAPAEVNGVRQNKHVYEILVPRHLMPAAVGERGLNALLAGQLVGVTVVVVATSDEPVALGS